MQLVIDETQRSVLQDVLDSAFRDLKSEIADTDNSRFKAGLVDRRKILAALLDAVGGPLADRP